MTIKHAADCAVFAAALVLAGCGGPPSEVLAMKMELHALKQELEFIRQQAEDLDPRVSAAEQMAVQVLEERDAPLRLDCTQRVPGVLPTRLAGLGVICEEAVANQDGLRIRLKLGNPTSARLEGLKLTLYAGDGASRGRSDKRLYVETGVSLPPGAWTSLDVAFPGIDATAVRDLAVRGEVSMLALARK
jgi:hypothetical protein